MGGISSGEHPRFAVNHGGRRRTVRGCVRAVRGDRQVSKPVNLSICFLLGEFSFQHRTAARATRDQAALIEAHGLFKGKVQCGWVEMRSPHFTCGLRTSVLFVFYIQSQILCLAPWPQQEYKCVRQSILLFKPGFVIKCFHLVLCVG